MRTRLPPWVVFFIQIVLAEVNVIQPQTYNAPPIYVDQGYFSSEEVLADTKEEVFSFNKVSELQKWLTDNTANMAEMVALLKETTKGLLVQAQSTVAKATTSTTTTTRITTTATTTTTIVQTEPPAEEPTTSTALQYEDDTTTISTTTGGVMFTESTYTYTTTTTTTSTKTQPTQATNATMQLHHPTYNHGRMVGQELEAFKAMLPDDLLSSIQLKNGKQKYGPPISVFGDGNFKTIFINEHIVRERGIYMASNKKSTEPNVKSTMINFYEKSVPGFDREIHICQLTDGFKRWAVLGKPCDPSKNQHYGYRGFVAKYSYEDKSGKNPVLFGRVASNRAIGMPFGTRVWNEAMPTDGNDICCKGADRSFRPCCHYRWYPWGFKMPAGWSNWQEWGKCERGKQTRYRSCNGLPGQCKAFWAEAKSKTPWKVDKPCSATARLQLPTPPTTRATTRKTTRATTTTRAPATKKPTWTQKWTPKATVTPYTTKAYHGSGWSPWTSWNKCSRSCGGGIQFRERTCSKNCPMNRGWHQEPRNCGMVQCPPGERSRWGIWSKWGACDRPCGMGFKTRYIQCEDGACKQEDPATYPAQRVPCYVKQFCDMWKNWQEWSSCSTQCGGGTRNRIRGCEGATPGLQGCSGSQYDSEKCNSQACQTGEPRYSAANEYKMPRAYQPSFSLNPFQQECIDFHNFFRALHNLSPLKWRADLTMTAQLWANQLQVRAKKGPQIVTGRRTKHWPHSDSGTAYRAKNVGENIAWDLTENGHPCKESVYRWYAELFYFNPKKATKGRRGSEPVGHLTQLLWPDTTHLGCATVASNIRQPPNTVPHYLESTYTVCHYAPQGNIIGQFEKKWADLDKSICSTYNNYKGSNKCANAGFSNCMGMAKQSTCGCNQVTKNNFSAKVVKQLYQANSNKQVKHTEVPMCEGTCLIYCENKWGTRNYWPHECIGRSKCTCGPKGAICD